MGTRKRKEREIEKINGSFVMGWVDFLMPQEIDITDSKGRYERTDVKPAKAQSRLMLKLEDGSCIVANGDPYKSLKCKSIELSLDTLAPGAMAEVREEMSERYEPGKEVKLRKTTFSDTGKTVYDEI